MKSPVKGKKGITLVELIVASAISVIIMAAACTMLYAGSKSVKYGATSFTNHGDAYIVEKQLRNNLFKAIDADVYKNSDSLPAPDDDNNIVEVYFDSNKKLWVKTRSTDSAQESSIENDSIEKLKLVKNMVKDNDNTVIANIKPTVSYTITAKNNKTTFDLSGGITANNVTDPSMFSLSSVTIKNTDTGTYFVIIIPRK